MLLACGVLAGVHLKQVHVDPGHGPGWWLAYVILGPGFGLEYIHSFNQPVVLEHLLCARPCSRNRACVENGAQKHARCYVLGENK